MHFRLGLGLALVLALGVMGAACGKDSEVSLAQYFERLGTIVFEINQRDDALQREFGGLADRQAEPQDYLTRRNEIAGDALAALIEIQPPAEVQDAHNDFLDSLLESAEAVQDVVDLLQYRFSTPGRGDPACLALLEIASKNSIAVWLPCGLIGEG